jgi:hypothetical protein
MFGTGLALVGLQAAQAQVTIDITKITCSEFLAGDLTDSRSLAIWLNGYVNGARGKTLIEPLSAGHNPLVRYSTLTRWFWMLPETFMVPTNSYLAFMSSRNTRDELYIAAPRAHAEPPPRSGIERQTALVYSGRA